MKFKQWNLRASSPAALEAMEAANVPPLVARVLCARGLDSREKAEGFLASDEGLLNDPFLLRDMDKAVARLQEALAAGEPIAVYGDYDVDGITSTCLLTDFLRSLGGRVTPYIPDRMEEGYGLNAEALDALYAKGVKLVVTVDCGITAVEEARHARELGIGLIITDHHECKAAMPAADAVVDPHRPDCPYPCKTLAGVGVALKLALALGEAPSRRAGEIATERGELLRRYADLAAIGTVADVMSVVGENRCLVRLGLEALSHTQRPGLRALLKEAGLGEKPLTSVSIGYTLAPRINASGRMGCAGLAAELLLTQDEARAEALAKELCALNRERQSIESEIYEECVALADALSPEERPALVLASEGWHQGVVGIVASRLSEKYSCPAFMICLQDGHGKGSCRSFGGFNLFAALEQCADLLEGFGGHELAAGFTILEEHIPAFRARMCALVHARTGGAGMVSALELDVEVTDPGLLTQEDILALDMLEPYGTGNQRPTFLMTGCTVTALSEVGGGRHLKLKVSKAGRSFDAIFFSATVALCGLSAGDRVDLAFYPQINEYRGWRSVQLQVVDLRPALTRAQAERALYEKLCSGEDLTAREAAALTPSREEFAAVWRYVKGRSASGLLEETAGRLSRNVARAFGLRETYMRTMVCLEVMDERGLIWVERTTDHLRIGLNETEGKVDLEQSRIMQRLRKIIGQQM